MTTRMWRQEAGDGSVTLRIQANPGAKSTAVVGGYGEGVDACLRIALAAPPVDGKANTELLAFLARAFGVSQRNVSLLHGRSSRRKIVRIEAPTLRPDGDWD